MTTTTNFKELANRIRRGTSEGGFSGMLRILTSDNTAATTTASSSTPANEKTIKLRFSMDNADCLDLEGRPDREIFETMLCLLSEISHKLHIPTQLDVATKSNGAAGFDSASIVKMVDVQNQAIADMKDSFKKSLEDIDTRLKAHNI